MRKIIAIVEDDVASLAALTSLVDSLGYETLGFAHPRTFLESGAARAVDALIADIRLPLLSGIALHRHLVAAGIAPPTLLVTAYPDEATRRLAREAGIAGYLAKPVAPDELHACLKRVTLKDRPGG